MRGERIVPGLRIFQGNVFFKGNSFFGEGESVIGEELSFLERIRVLRRYNLKVRWRFLERNIFWKGAEFVEDRLILEGTIFWRGKYFSEGVRNF